MFSALDIAKYVLKRQEEYPMGISNLKLQKLLYYIQAYHLVFTGNPIFEDAIEAWEYGPVVPDVYKYYKSYGFDLLPVPPDKIQIDNVDSIGVISSVLSTYGDRTAMELVYKTHTEDPWMNSYQPGENNVIPHSLLKKYYKKFTKKNGNRKRG